MAEYIDREAALKIAEKFHEYGISYQLSQLPITNVGTIALLYCDGLDLSMIPTSVYNKLISHYRETANLVNVIRCKDCKWFGKLGCAIYIYDDSDRPKEDDYCSFGERREDAETN